MPVVSTTPRHTAALLLAPRLGKGEESTLVELEKLLAGLGIRVVETMAQRATPLGSPHLIGSGKLQELKARIAHHLEEAPPEGDIILVVAADITPSEQRTLERAVGVTVLDRCAVILRVFSQRAQTTLARLEIALAQAQFELPRVRDDATLGDREGGGGRAARGSSNVELRKQLLRRSIVDLKRRIKAAEQAVAVQVKARSDKRRVALVGYTNAGKSSLLQALSGQDAYVADELFATLATTVRALPGVTPPVLISDTVGFLRALPHELLRSFRSTLKEALSADLRFVVVDAANEDWQEQLAVARQVLSELGSNGVSEVIVFNKVDLLDSGTLAELHAEHPDALFVSARRLEDVARLRAFVVQFFESMDAEATVTVSFADGRRLAAIHEQAHVVSRVRSAEGLRLLVRGPKDTLARLGLGCAASDVSRSSAALRKDA